MKEGGGVGWGRKNKSVFLSNTDDGWWEAAVQHLTHRTDKTPFLLGKPACGTSGPRAKPLASGVGRGYLCRPTLGHLHPGHPQPASAQAWMGVSSAQSRGPGEGGLKGSTSAADKKEIQCPKSTCNQCGLSVNSSARVC